MIRFSLTVSFLFVVTLTAVHAQSTDSLLIGTIQPGGSVSLVYPPATLMCAMEQVVGVGTIISDVGVENLGPRWAIVGDGTFAGSGLSLAYGLAQHGSQLYLRTSMLWDRCDGVQCTSCRVRMDEEGDGYCDCKKKANPTGYCNHSTGTSGSAIIGAILLCSQG